MHHLQNVGNQALLQGRLASIPELDTREFFVGASPDDIAATAEEVLARQIVPKPPTRNAVVERTVIQRLIAASGDPGTFDSAVLDCKNFAPSETEFILNAARGVQLYIGEMCSMMNQSIGQMAGTMRELAKNLQNLELRLTLSEKSPHGNGVRPDTN